MGVCVVWVRVLVGVGEGVCGVWGGGCVCGWVWVCKARQGGVSRNGTTMTRNIREAKEREGGKEGEVWRAREGRDRQ